MNCTYTRACAHTHPHTLFCTDSELFIGSGLGIFRQQRLGEKFPQCTGAIVIIFFLQNIAGWVGSGQEFVASLKTAAPQHQFYFVRSLSPVYFSENSL